MHNFLGKIGAFIYCSALLGASVAFTISDADKNLNRTVTIEAGSKIRIEDFFVECPEDAGFITDISAIDTKIPAVYRLRVIYDRVFEKDVILKIEDHTAPKGIPLPKMQYASLEWPEASECVGCLYDLSGIARIEYLNGTPSYEYTGDYTVPVVVTDWYDNSTIINVPFHVTDDHNAPLFYGIHDITIGCSEDAVIDYYSGITWKDDYDEDPKVVVDTSRVKMGEAGSYVITYKAKDEAGNVRRQDATVNIKEEVFEDGVRGTGAAWDTTVHREVYKIAEDLVAKLKGKNETETARNIYTWVHSNIFYRPVNESQTFEEAALRGFTQHGGDCFTYYSTCKMLLDCAGIENMMVIRYPIQHNGHYWNLVKLDGEWYHCDSTLFDYHWEVFFKCTDEEIKDGHHRFDGSMLPVRAGGTPEYITEQQETENIE